MTSETAAIDRAAITHLATEAAAELGIVGAQVAVAVGDEFAECPVGIENIATGRAVTADTLFQIGSTTKMFTAVLMMQLVDAGLVDIDEPVASYLPEFRLGDERATRTVTPRHLMSMTSGIDNGPYTDPGWGPDAVRSAVETVAELPVMGQPGTGFGYTNASTNISGRIIEVLTGSTWDTALRDRLLEPAGLRHSTSLVEEQIYHPVAVGHIATDDGPRHAGPWIFGRGSGPSGSSLCCSAGDLVRFGRMFLRGGLAADGTRVLSGRSVSAMQTQQVDVPSKYLADGWCLGPYTQIWDGVRLFGHSGKVPCGASALLWAPEHDTAVAVTLNVADQGAPFADRVIGGVLKEILGIEKPAPPVGDPAARVDPAPYVGVYDSHELHYRVTADDGRLFVKTSPSRSSDLPEGIVQPTTTELFPLGDHRFLPKTGVLGGDRIWDVAFYLGDDGRADRFLNGPLAARRVA
ncbi:serine hydrolase domain-containing protein [Streptomyces sp. NPDC004838]